MALNQEMTMHRTVRGRESIIRSCFDKNIVLLAEAPLSMLHPGHAVWCSLLFLFLSNSH